MMPMLITWNDAAVTLLEELLEEKRVLEDVLGYGD